MSGAELPNFVTLAAQHLKSPRVSGFLLKWENIIFSLFSIIVIVLTAYFASRKIRLIPSRLQAAFELFVAAVDDFVCGIIGPDGRKYTPFIGTLFI